MENDYNPRTFSKTNQADGEYFGYRIGDHYEWTLYGARYDKPDYGHRYEWSKPGLSAMSLCLEVDGETGGQRYRQAADDAHCPKYEAEYSWNVPDDGQPSRCLKVDKLTHGLRFSRIVDSHQCAKPATIFVWEKKAESLPPYCVEIDGGTLGGVYRQSAPDYLCARTVDVVVAYGRKQALQTRPLPQASRAPASAATSASAARKPPPLELDPRFREEPEELEDGVDHVHRSADKIHRR